MARADRLISIVAIAVALALFAVTFSFPSPDIVRTSPGFLPRIYIGLFIIFAVVLFMQTRSRNKEADSKVTFDRFSFVLMIVFGIYLLSMIVLGFYLSTLLLIAVLLWLSRIRVWWIIVSMPLIVLLFVYIVFSELLNVNLPLGLLFS